MYVYNVMSLCLLAAVSDQIKNGAHNFGTGFRVILEMWLVK
jgi:hypothetical protein